MVVVGVDTSGDRVGVGVIADGIPIAETLIPAENRSLPRILPAIDRVLVDASRSIRDVDLFSVVVGPGSWTGLRLGVTTVKTLAYALGAPAVGTDTFTALAYGVRYAGRPVIAVVGARGGLVFVAEYRTERGRPAQVAAPHLVPLESLPTHVSDLALIVGDVPAHQLSALPSQCLVASPRYGVVSPIAVAEAGLHRFEEAGPAEIRSLVPEYLKEPELTLATEPR